MNDNRHFIIQIAFILIGLIFIIKLFFIQVWDSNYKLAAENNIVRKDIEPSYRGLIYDRNGKLLVYNQPVYNLMVVPKEIKKLEKQQEFLQSEIAKDKKVLKRLSDPEELEKFAREHYYLKKKDEEIYLIEYEDSLKQHH